MSIEINIVIDSINLLIIIVIDSRRSTIDININSTLNIEKSNVDKINLTNRKNKNNKSLICVNIIMIKKLHC